MAGRKEPGCGCKWAATASNGDSDEEKETKEKNAIEKTESRKDVQSQQATPGASQALENARGHKEIGSSKDNQRWTIYLSLALSSALACQAVGWLKRRFVKQTSGFGWRFSFYYLATRPRSPPGIVLS